MRKLDSDLWVTDHPLRFFGVEVGARMTVVRLPGEKLWLHSPVPATGELVEAVRALGTVAYLVAPNRLHHLYVSEWQGACPGAATYVAPGLDTKRSDLEIAGVLGDEAEAGWQGEIDQVFIEGLPFANEVAFFHRRSATLIVADLAFNIRASSPLLTRLAFRSYGAYGRLGPTVVERLMVRDRSAFRRSIESVLAWPFERVVVAHGEVVEQRAREQLTEGYAWLLGASR